MALRPSGQGTAPKGLAFYEELPVAGGRATVLHHPGGSDLQVSDRHNLIVSVNPPVVRYLADTEAGSSGAPVFDENWRLIAIHQGGRVGVGNTGILVASIAQLLRRRYRNARLEQERLRPLLGAF